MLESHKNREEYRFYNETIPNVAENLERIASALEEQNRMTRICMESQGIVSDKDEEVVCKFCGRNERADYAYLHQEGFVCCNCWDERLKASE